MKNGIQGTNDTVYIVGTFDTKKSELFYVRDLIEAAGVRTTLVDVGIRSTENALPTSVRATADLWQRS